MNSAPKLHTPVLTESVRRAARADLLRKASKFEDQKRLRRRVQLFAGAAAIVTLGAGLYPVVHPPSAYASWTPVPTSTVIDADNPQVKDCENALPEGPAELVGREPLSPVLTEKRGNFTATLLGATDSIALCIFDAESRGSARTLATPLPSNQEVSVLASGGSLNEGEGARYVYGRTASNVATVKVTTSDKEVVTASVSNGFFLAWWPAGPSPTLLTAADVTESTLAQIDLR